MDETHPTGRQLAAARALIGVSQAEVATAARISVPTLKRMEASDGPAAGMPNNVLAVQRVLEGWGIEFIIDEDGTRGVTWIEPEPEPEVAF